MAAPPPSSSSVTSRRSSRGSWRRGARARSCAPGFWEVAVRVRHRSELLGELDLVSQDVLVDVLRTLEEQLWMIRGQLAD